MIIFSRSGEPNVARAKGDPFRLRLYAIMLALSRYERSGAVTHWHEAATAPPPTTIAQRRMLERLLLTYASCDRESDAPAWLSPGVKTATLHNAGAGGYIAPQYNDPGRAAGAAPGAGLGPGVAARRPDDLQGRAGTTGGPGLTPLNRAGTTPGAGAYRAGRVVVVGDRPGPGWGARAPSWPFVSANRGGCSAWLAEQLELAQIGEEQLYWVNAYGKDGTPLEHGEVEALPLWLTTSTLIVALGRNAARWCAAGRWGCAEVHHPQYWKRFHSNEPYHLLKLLRRHLCG